VNIGDRIRIARKAAGLSQEEVARRAGLSLKGMGEIERGDIEDPHISSLAKIARALGVPVEALIKEEEEAAVAGKAEASQEAGRAEAEWQRPSLDQVRDTFAPLADGLNRYCARWEEMLPNLQGTSEEVADFFFDLQDFSAIILRVFEDELYAIAEALDLGSHYGGKRGLPRDMAVGFIRAEVEEHSLMRKALDRYIAVGQALAESTGNEEMAESMRQALAGVV
jgi:transcriptional regulator with XRE-family HTH domain